MAPADGFLGDVVAAASDPVGDAGDGQVGGGEPEEDQVKPIAVGDEGLQPGGERTGGERRLEAEIGAGGGRTLSVGRA